MKTLMDDIIEARASGAEPPESMVGLESDSTTLEKCGWCKYAMGSHRYNYCYSGTCCLMAYGGEIVWCDECKFKKYAKGDIEGIIKRHEYAIDSAKASIEDRKEKIAFLEKLAKDRPCRPPLPDDRDEDYFEEGRRIVVYVSDYKNWYFGEIKMGYRSGDGCVSYKLDKIGPRDNGFWGCGCKYAYCLREGDYHWFKDHPAEYEEWLTLALSGEAEKIAIV